jgi:TniQ
MFKLLLRPTVMPEEWWDSYVARVLAENGHAPTREYMLGKLEPIVAQLVSDEVKRRAMAGDALTETLRTYSRWTLPAWAVRGTKSAAAYCPNCFSDEPNVRLSWRLRAVTHCAAHASILQTRCFTCSRLIFHWDLARRVCRCGAALGQSRASTRRAHDAVAARECSMYSENGLFSSQDALKAITQPSSSSEAAYPEALAVMVLMGKLLPALVEVRVAGLADEARTTTGFIKVLGLTLSPSMDSVHELLEALPSAAHLRAALNVILSLRHAEQRGGSVLGRLPFQEWAEKLCAVGASPAMAERRGLIEVGTFRRALVPLKVAAPQAGLTEMHLHSLMERGLVVPTRTFEVGERQHLFSPEQVQFLTRFRHQGYSYGNAFDLGLEGSGVHVLRAARIVGMVPGNAGRTWLDGEELRALLAALSKRAIEVQAVNAQMLNLGSKRVWQNRYVPVLKTLFVKLLAGEVALWAFGDRPGFARFYLGVDALELLHRGSVVGHAGSDTDSQPALVLSGGVGSWTPTPTPWTRQPRLGAPRSSWETSPQLSLDLA